MRGSVGLSLPRGGVYDTGTRQVVFAKRNETESVPVEVEVLGGNDNYAILSGVSTKDEAFTSAAFRLGSEAGIFLLIGVVPFSWADA